MRLRPIFIMAGLAVLSGCVPPAPRQPPPSPEPQRPVLQPAQPVLPPPVGTDWRDLPLTPGAWYYKIEAGSPQAIFGPPNSEATFIVRCDLARRQIKLSRAGTATGSVMTVRTTSGARNFPMSVQTEPLPYLVGTAAANDRFLDDIVFSRGRFTVQAQASAMLVLPAWPEPARVIEECRG